MSKKSKRQQQILMQLAASPNLRVNVLAAELAVTTETIRRDLEELTEQGLVDRTYGGAILRQNGEPALVQRQHDSLQEKESIARAVIPLLKDAKVLMLGSGATTTEVAKRIAFEMRDIMVMTHSFSVAAALAHNPTIRILMVPGIYHASEGATHGSQAIRFLQDFTADVAILGASAVSDNGPSDVLVEAADVYAVMARQAEKTIVVADHSKFNRTATACWARWESLALLVTDQTPDEALTKALQSAETQVLTTVKN